MNELPHKSEPSAQLFVFQFILGLIFLFTFFAMMTGGEIANLLVTATVGLLVNFFTSWKITTNYSEQAGVKAALCFVAPAVLGMLFSLTDFSNEGNAQPVLFWGAAAAVTFYAGFRGTRMGKGSNKEGD